jgi:Protein of unknown function (DUF1553)/Protein of unknown function (DUF1549)/Concanavalin A-like lectin/glucanases superfamily/Planctomycete cytochrome C
MRAIVRKVALFVSSFAVLGVGVFANGGPKPSPKLREKIEFNRDIRPILAKCLTCHGHDEKQIQAGLRLDTFKGATMKLRSGERAIVPGHPEQSELIARINDRDPDVIMPPASSNKILSSEEKLLLTQWIQEGAVFKPHWAFEKPVRPAVPKVRQAAWVRNPIDNFILAKLEKEGLKPSPEADRNTLIRRVTLDLIGLPPSPEEVVAFRNDTKPGAYERVVDRLLASPRYGERMAMDWMDYARYADSNGYQADWERFQWRWRDWVINAYNANMPYDQFTVEQLAGDLLPHATMDQKIATGFNRNHRINTEGGVVAEEWRVENVIDRVETTSTVWLGLTSGCARCHDHKYDPIKQKDFYSLFAYFNNVPESGTGEERPVNHPPILSAPTPEQTKARFVAQSKLDKLRADLRSRILTNIPKSANWQVAADAAPASLGEGLVGQYSFRTSPSVLAGSATAPKVVGQPKFDDGHGHGSVKTDSDNYLDLGNVGDFERTEPFSYAVWLNPESANASPVSRMDAGNNYRGWDLFLSGGKPSIHIISSWPTNALKVNGKAMIPEHKWTHVAVTYDGSSKPSGIHMYINGQAIETETEMNGLTESIRTPVTAKVGRRTGADAFNGQVEDLALYKKVLTADEVQHLADFHPERTILAIEESKRTPEQRETLASLWSRQHDADFAKLEKSVNTAAEEVSMIDSQVTSVMVMDEMPKPRPAYVLVRGEYDKHGAKVTARVPSFLPTLPKGVPNNRLGLARWIVSADNPLTARVTVNRFWERLFGTGIVATSEDFGTRAEFPSHPELLDWLATEFVRLHWDQKAILREIVTSATYRQSSKVTPAILAKDPVNRLLARGPRFRLSAEVIRDQALYAGGQLREKIGGPSVRPYQPEGIWDETNVYGNLRNYKHDTGEGLYRRSLYTIWKRTAAPPNMTLFDAATRETCRVRRSRTDTPLQALALLNDVTYVESARSIAQGSLQAASAEDARISWIYQRLLGRNPSAAETKILKVGLKRRLEHFRKNPQAAEKLVAIGDLARPKADNPVELAAYTILASTVLNLDETITKE